MSIDIRDQMEKRQQEPPLTCSSKDLLIHKDDGPQK